MNRVDLLGRYIPGTERQHPGQRRVSSFAMMIPQRFDDRLTMSVYVHLDPEIIMTPLSASERVYITGHIEGAVRDIVVVGAVHAAKLRPGETPGDRDIFQILSNQGNEE